MEKNNLVKHESIVNGKKVKILRFPKHHYALEKRTELCYNNVQNRQGGIVMPRIRPITDLRNTNEISEACHARQEPIFITKNGYGDMVIMSIETYEQLAENSLIDSAIAEAELEYQKQGVLLDAAETLAALRRKHIG